MNSARQAWTTSPIEQNVTAYRNAQAELELYQSPEYYQKIRSENYERFVQEEYPQALDQVQQERREERRANIQQAERLEQLKLDAAREYRASFVNGEMDNGYGLAVGILPAIGYGSSAEGYEGYNDMDIRFLIPGEYFREFPANIGGYLHFRFSLNGDEYRDGGFFKGFEYHVVGTDDGPSLGSAWETSGAMAKIPMGFNLGVFGRFGRCLDAGGVDICPSIEVGVGFDPIHVVGGTFIGTVEFPIILGSLAGAVNGFLIGLEVYADFGVNIGPVRLSGGIYPNGRSVMFAEDNQEELGKKRALVGLNPGFRFEWDF